MYLARPPPSPCPIRSRRPNRCPAPRLIRLGAPRRAFRLPSDRLAHLEARVAALEAEVTRLHAQAPPYPAAAPPQPMPAGASAEPPPLRAPRPPRPGARPAAPRPRLAVPAVHMEDVLGKAGIGLVLVGVVFFLKWTIDQGWLTPAVRVGGAAAFGVALVAAGLRLRTSRSVLGGALGGGGLAVLYGSLFAASALYGFIAPGTALLLATLLTAASYGLAVATGLSVLALVASLGALGLPMLLYEEPASLPTTLAFVALVVAGGVAVWWKKGWPELLAALALGAWTTLALVRWKAGGLVGTERHLVQATVVLAWALLGVVPLLRRTGAARGGPLDVAPGDAPGGFWKDLPALVRPLGLAVWTSALAAAVLTAVLWHFSSAGQATFALAATLAYGFAATRRRDEAAEALALGALLLGTWSIGAGLPDAAIPGTMVAFVALGAWLALRQGWTETAVLARATTAAAAVGAVGYYAFFSGPRFNGPGVAGAVAGTAAMAVLALRDKRLGRGAGLLLVGAHALALSTLRYALGPLPLGTALVNGAWGLYAVGLIVYGLRQRLDTVRMLGLGTLALTIGKVLVFDLRGIPMAARVVLFVGLGLLLLAVSYFAPQLLRGPAGSTSPGDALPPEHPADIPSMP